MRSNAGGGGEMTFGESIQTVFRKYADFNGRASRSEFWWWILFSFLVSAALNLVLNLSIQFSTGFSGAAAPIAYGSSLAGLWGIAVLLPTLDVTVRRLRDAGYGWGHVFWLLVPIAGIIVLAT